MSVGSLIGGTVSSETGGKHCSQAIGGGEG